MFIDTHCHLNFSAFSGGEAKIISRAKSAGVGIIIVPGTDIQTSAKAVEIAQSHQDVYALVGIHPHHATQYLSGDRKMMDDDMMQIDQWLTHPRVRGIGEVGLDRHTYATSRYGPQIEVSQELFDIQRELFVRQVEIVASHGVTLCVHNREATTDLIEVWGTMKTTTVALRDRVVLHCCEPDPRLLSFASSYDMYIGVDGDVTYDDAKRAFIREVPLTRLVLETDSPYILPEPLRSQKKYPNTPSTIPLIAQSVAEIHHVSLEEVRDVTSSNARKLFALPE